MASGSHRLRFRANHLSRAIRWSDAVIPASTVPMISVGITLRWRPITTLGHAWKMVWSFVAAKPVSATGQGMSDFECAAD